MKDVSDVMDQPSQASLTATAKSSSRNNRSYFLVLNLRLHKMTQAPTTCDLQPCLSNFYKDLSAPASSKISATTCNI